MTDADDVERDRVEVLEDRIGALEERLALLERGGKSPGAGFTDLTGSDADSPGLRADTAATSAAVSESAWILTESARRYPGMDAVHFAGTAQLPEGPVAWQWGRPTAELLGRDFADAGERLAALSHPVRLALVQAVLAGTSTSADLTALPGMGTSGQVYHHLHQLAATGWLQSPRRGHWRVPADRVVPLLVIIMAATD
ncbi:ArsR family transcriptional regulator [Brevibacterium sp. 50QC2O2]|uniref:ArsR/SmtB family transcription factor n=1 Tax=Brevibacterium TaxID=1696 RepID=UPI00211CCE25|nr:MULTISPECIES: ArsR family transcriptional regulator [unclassified Brevibacterium]MCQ9386128.1 ArsR family transcriptional regulator [Brevibacterium sp. 68QC2CO]MCQ9387188.1 ArsR family transcriptional regulator [Brevibacterium sp. 50QC2O2]